MGLWIRSQDKLSLIKVKKIKFGRNFDNEATIYGYEGYDNYESLGTFKSKERALEVLDEIHQRLIDLQTLEITPDFYKVCKRNLDNVYEMPKE